MKAVAVHEKGRVGIVDLGDPDIREYECLVKNLTCGFCNSTDLKTIDDHLGSPIPFPVILGHEQVGEVVEVGSKVRNWKVGDRMMNPSGRIPQGSPFRPYWTGMVEYSVVQDHDVMREMGIDEHEFVARNAQRIAEGISAEDAAVILTLSEAYSALDNFGFAPGMDVLIVGDGPVGVALSMFMRLNGAGWITVVGHHEDRLERAISVGGADAAIDSGNTDLDTALDGRRFDLVVDAVGRISIILDGARRLKQRGRVGIYGVIPRDDRQLDLLLLPNNTGVHILCYPYDDKHREREIMDRALKGELDLSAFYSHVLPMSEIEQAVDLIRSRGAFKVLLRM